MQFTPMKETEGSALKQSKSQLHELNKPKMPTKEGGLLSHHTTVLLPGANSAAAPLPPARDFSHTSSSN